MGNEPRQTAGKPQGMWRRAFPVTASLVIAALGSGYSVSMLKPETPRSAQEDRMKTLVTLLALTVSVAAPALAQDRMPPIPAEKMTEAQKKAVADYKSIRNTDLVAPPWTNRRSRKEPAATARKRECRSASILPEAWRGSAAS